jgi:hypothetical protein
MRNAYRILVPVPVILPGDEYKQTHSRCVSISVLADKAVNVIIFLPTAELSN